MKIVKCFSKIKSAHEITVTEIYCQCEANNSFKKQQHTRCCQLMCQNLVSFEKITKF